MAKAAGGSTNKSDVFDAVRLREFIKLMEECGLNELDLKQADQQIRLVRGVAGAVGPPQVVSAPAPTAAVAATPAPETPAADGAHIKLIKAPMVGTFYIKSNPKADDFVKVGSKISADTVVCIVEAMKVFNEIPAEMSGTIVEILASNEEPVDYDRPLFKVDTRG